MGRYACCEPVARGLAFWKGKVIIATLDGQLIGLNAKNGKPVWTAQTWQIGLYHHRYRVFDGMVVVAMAAPILVRADLSVPGMPTPASSCGSSSWSPVRPRVPMRGLRQRDVHGGKSLDRPMFEAGRRQCLDSIAYDPELQLVCIGTGVSLPMRSCIAVSADNLFLCSIVALDADWRL
jgi:quinohemoprotein ethanol dehydrogenase